MKTDTWMVRFSWVIALGLLVTPSVQGLTINTFTEMLSESDTGPAGLSAEAIFTYDDTANQLMLSLQNTSLASVGSGAGVLLTGIGFNLPEGMSILGGSASMLGSTAINFVAPLDGDVSSEWGYNNTATGHFTDPALYDYVAIVSTMVADTGPKFADGYIENPEGLAGPGMGILTDGGNAGGQHAIRDTTLFTLDLDGTFTLNNVAKGSEVLLATLLLRDLE